MTTITAAQYQARQTPTPARRKQQNLEKKLQKASVRWFRATYPNDAESLYAVPNGGARDGREASSMKDEGVTRGVSDLCLDIARGGFFGFKLEAKILPNKPNDNQKAFLERSFKNGYRVTVFYSLDQFISEVTEYMNQRPTEPMRDITEEPDYDEGDLDWDSGDVDWEEQDGDSANVLP